MSNFTFSMIIIQENIEEVLYIKFLNTKYIK